MGKIIAESSRPSWFGKAHFRLYRRIGGSGPLALVNLNSARGESPNRKAIGNARPHFNEVVMRDDAVEAAVVFVDELVTGSTVAIEGTFNSDGRNRRRIRISRLIHSEPAVMTSALEWATPEPVAGVG